MGKYYCIPTYYIDTFSFNNVVVAVTELQHWLVNDLLTYSEIAEELTKRCNTTIGRSAVQKLVKHYQIVLDQNVKLERHKRRAQKTAQNLEASLGVKNVFQLDSTKDKAKQTKLTRYGDANFVNIAKAKKTCKERYGVENYSSTISCRNKVAATNLARYGAKTPAENTDILQKMKNTCVDRYGVANYWQSDIFKKQQQKLYFEKYTNLTSEYKQIYQDKNKLTEYIALAPDKTTVGLANSLGISRESLYMLLAKHDLLDLIERRPNNSHYEAEIAEYIGLDLCVLSDRTVLNGKEIDIYIPSKKIGIEFNGNYWHSSIYKDKKYHFDKSILATEAGVRLIHIWEYEWTDPMQQKKIKFMLDAALGRIANKIYARQCIIKQISNSEAKVLNNNVHLQGHRDANITYGLFYNDELVQLMSFSRTKYNRNLDTANSWEIIRGCPGSNNFVIGGVGKLLTHFIKEHKPDKIFSYCDFNKFDGKSYEAVGMTFIGYTGFDMKWLLPDGTVANRKPKHHSELKEIAIAQLFGAGSKKYI